MNWNSQISLDQQPHKGLNCFICVSVSRFQSLGSNPGSVTYFHVLVTFVERVIFLER